MDLQVLPLAVTMMVGPQIMSAIIFVTTPQAVRISLAFLVGVAVATAVGVTITWGIFSALGGAVSTGKPSDKGSAGTIIQLVLVALLLLIAVKNYVRRATVEPPKWLGALMSAGPKKALTTGLLVIGLMPSDIMVMLTVGAHLEHHDGNPADALPFIGATVLVAALPLLVYLLLRKRAERVMPRLREWVNTHSWVVNIATCLIFVGLLLSP